jgi:hypothetical protein
LHWRGPDGWQRFLNEQREQCIGRYLKIARLLDAIDAQAHCDNLAFVALKGAALHAIGIYAPGERPMGDIDLLIRPRDARAVASLLRACSYEAALSIGRHEVFQPVARKALDTRLGEHVDNPIKIEVHTQIAERLPVAAVDITQYLWSPEMRAGLNGYPSIVPLMMHLLLHAAGNMRARALRHIQLHDIALLAARFDPGDWERLPAARPDGRSLWWALAPLMLTARYYPAAFQRLARAFFRRMSAPLKPARAPPEVDRSFMVEYSHRSISGRRMGPHPAGGASVHERQDFSEP